MEWPDPPCKRVLVVDDDPDTLYAIADLLQIEGVEVIEAARSIAEAERALANGFRPSAVILDLHLNGERGETLLERLRADPRYANLPVIALSGDGVALRRLRGDVDGTLSKPAGLNRIIQALGDVCARPGASAARRAAAPGEVGHARTTAAQATLARSGG